MNTPARDRGPVWPADRNVVLTGFMGTGKSTVGRAVAARLGYDFVDTDDLIEARYGSVASIFETRGEAVFRDLEHTVASELASGRRTVIATGGRLMLDERNVAVFAGSSRMCCLVAPTNEIVARLVADRGRHERPLLQATDGGPALTRRIEQLLAERDEGYRRFLRVETGQRRPEAIADEIAAVFGAAPTRLERRPPVVIGAGLLPVLSDLVGPIGRVAGDESARFVAQVAVAGGDTLVTLGATPDVEPAVDPAVDPVASTVWVPTVVPSGPAGLVELIAQADLSAGRPPLVATVIDVAVLQAMEPGCTPWPELIARVTSSLAHDE